MTKCLHLQLVHVQEMIYLKRTASSDYEDRKTKLPGNEVLYNMSLSSSETYTCFKTLWHIFKLMLGCTGYEERLGFL